MTIIDSINELLGDDLKGIIKSGNTLRIAESCFSINAYAELIGLGELSEFGNLFIAPGFQKQ
jgi:hypothetical protein